MHQVLEVVVGKAHDMYPSVVSSLMGESPTCGQDTAVILGAVDWCSCTDFLMISSSVMFLVTTGNVWPLLKMKGHVVLALRKFI